MNKVAMNKDVVERNLAIVMSLTQFILDQPQILDQLPPDFRLVLLPDDDPELARYNFDLLGQEADAEQPVVFVRLSSGLSNFDVHPPKVHVPIPV